MKILIKFMNILIKFMTLDIIILINNNKKKKNDNNNKNMEKVITRSPSGFATDSKKFHTFVNKYKYHHSTC